MTHAECPNCSAVVDPDKMLEADLPKGAEVRFIKSHNGVTTLEVVGSGSMRMDAETVIKYVEVGTYTYDPRTKELKPCPKQS